MAETQMQTHASVRKKLTTLRTAKLPIKMDMTTLDMIIQFLYKDGTLKTRKAITNIDKLFKSIDQSIYTEKEIALTNRIWIIEHTLEGILREGLVQPDIIKSYCKNDAESDDYKSDILEQLTTQKKQINYEESKYLLKQVDDRLAFGYTITLKHVIEELFSLIDESDVRSYKMISEDLYQIANSIINIKRRSNSLGSEQTFSLQEDVFETVVFDAMDRLNNRNRIFITGIRHLNIFLAPGYMSKRLYTYLAFPGGGKSQMLLKTALDIRKYNKGIQCKNPDNRPAVLMITMENSIEETIERIFNIIASDDDIRNYSPKQVKKMLLTGGLALKDKDNIDIIIKYYPNRSIDTNDLYGIIQDLEDEGVEVVALILDYLKRIKPAEKAPTEKEELKNITNELKDLATYWDIPVITAQQLNRTASSIVDAAIQAKKSDVTKLVGRDGVAGAWEINTMVSPYREVCKNNHSNCGDFPFKQWTHFMCRIYFNYQLIVVTE
jgi:replicative DNA helicase